MIAVICKNIKVYSFPLGISHQEGYATHVQRVCQVKYKKQRWTGFAVIPEHVITTGFYPHGKEFDLEFPDGVACQGFLTEDWGEVIELGVANMPKFEGLYCQHAPILIGQVLFVIGSILGIPYTLASCEVEKLIITERVMTCERLELLDEHSVGSPVFNHGGSLVGILEAFIETTDKMVIRGLTSNAIGLLKG